ncbi:hypothetical protein B9Z19DRAFT_1120400 [Tuber borchii]|uniref:Uncharacterized protein n=1 Tax=Tuber borchii TaxID=42251 RepID=A0A2T7A4L8_TUBBO|nr:hypothetical protein B9Z19DRAFT_1120400 [Tuber borchii]
MEHAEVESGGGIKIPLKRYVSSGHLQAYRRPPGPIGFRRPLKFGLYRPRPFLERPSLAQPMAYRLAYERPGPLETLRPTGSLFPEGFGSVAREDLVRLQAAVLKRKKQPGHLPGPETDGKCKTPPEMPASVYGPMMNMGATAKVLADKNGHLKKPS